MGFLSGLVSTVARVAVTPLTIAADTIDVLSGDLDAPSKTGRNLSLAKEDWDEAFDDLLDYYDE